MATQYAIIGTISGQTGLVAKLFARNGDTVLYTSDSVTPRTNALGQYLFTFGEPAVIPAGVYRLIAFTSGGLPLASGLRTFLGTDAETATTAPEPAELDSASITAVQSGLATAAALTAVANDVTTILGRVTATVATLWGALVEMISGTTPNRRFTAKALELGPSSAGGGDATAANQVAILAALTGTTITTTGFGAPDASGALLLKRGHTATVTFTSSTSNVVPDLSAGTTKVFFGVRTTSGTIIMQVVGTVVTATGLQSVSFAIPVSDAAALTAGVHIYDVIAIYGYNASSTPKYTSMSPFAGGYVRVQDVGIDLSEV